MVPFGCLALPPEILMDAEQNQVEWSRIALPPEYRAHQISLCFYLIYMVDMLQRCNVLETSSRLLPQVIEIANVPYKVELSIALT